MAAHSALTGAYTPNQVSYSNYCAIRDEEAAGSNPATPASSQALSGREKADSGAVQQQSTATVYSPSCLPSRLSPHKVLASDTSVYTFIVTSI
jgi:hypothetical protein